MRNHSLTAKELQIKLRQHGVSISLVAIYAILKDLLANDVLIKRSDTYVVNLSWLLATSQRLRELVDQVITGPHGAGAFQLEEIEQTGVARTWRVSSLVEINDLWVQLLIILLRRSDSNIVYELIPHLWYGYLPSYRDEYFQRTFKDLKADIRVCVQGRIFLDSEPIQNRNVSYRTIQLPRIEVPGNGTRYFASVDNWLTTLRIPSFLASQISDIFQKSRTDNASFRKELNRILRAKANCTLSLAFTPRRVKWLQGVIDQAEK